MALLKRKPARLPITSLFNAVLLLYLVVRATLFVISQPINDTANSYLSLMLSNYPTSGFLAMIFIALAILLWGAHLFQIFWNRFMNDMFKLRNLTFDEALAMILILAVIFGR